MKPRRLIYARAASRALKEIESYISWRESPQNAAEYIERIELRCRRLLLAPEQGTRQDQFRRGIRTTGFERRVTIAFRVTDDAVRIVAIAYAGRQYRRNL